MDDKAAKYLFGEGAGHGLCLESACREAGKKTFECWKAGDTFFCTGFDGGVFVCRLYGGIAFVEYACVGWAGVLEGEKEGGREGGRGGGFLVCMRTVRCIEN